MPSVAHFCTHHLSLQRSVPAPPCATSPPSPLPPAPFYQPTFVPNLCARLLSARLLSCMHQPVHLPHCYLITHPVFPPFSVVLSFLTQYGRPSNILILPFFPLFDGPPCIWFPRRPFCRAPSFCLIANSHGASALAQLAPAVFRLLCNSFQTTGEGRCKGQPPLTAVGSQPQGAALALLAAPPGGPVSLPAGPGGSRRLGGAALLALALLLSLCLAHCLWV